MEDIYIYSILFYFVLYIKQLRSEGGDDDDDDDDDDGIEECYTLLTTVCTCLVQSLNSHVVQSTYNNNPCYAKLCYAMLCYAMPCYVML